MDIPPPLSDRVYGCVSMYADIAGVSYDRFVEAAVASAAEVGAYRIAAPGTGAATPEAWAAIIDASPDICLNEIIAIVYHGQRQYARDHNISQPTAWNAMRCHADRIRIYHRHPYAPPHTLLRGVLDAGDLRRTLRLPHPEVSRSRLVRAVAYYYCYFPPARLGFLGDHPYMANRERQAIRGWRKTPVTDLWRAFGSGPTAVGSRFGHNPQHPPDWKPYVRFGSRGYAALRWLGDIYSRDPLGAGDSVAAWADRVCDAYPDAPDASVGGGGGGGGGVGRDEERIDRYMDLIRGVVG